MNDVAFMRELVAKGMSWEDAADIAERFHARVDAEVERQLAALMPKRSTNAERQAAYRERKRNGEHNANHNAERNAVTPEHNADHNSGDNAERNAPLSLPPSPRTPQPPTHTRVSVTSRERDAREEAGFARFWDAYPRKIGKADARKAFTKAWRKLPPFEEDAALIGGLERAKAAWTDAQFIPHAATWLNGERWNDEPTTVTPMRPHERPDRHHAPASSGRAAGRGVWAEILAEERSTASGG